MKQQLRVYRNHTPACIHGHRTPLYDADTSVPDCSCPLNVVGYLNHVVNPDGTLKRIRHKSLDTKDWHTARQTAEQWLQWEDFSEPLPDADLVNRQDVTIDQAVSFFFRYCAETHTRGQASRAKYEVLLNQRLKPWFQGKRKLFIRAFDDAVLVKMFFMSWVNLQPARGKQSTMEVKKPLALNTKRAELERYRTFLEFCRGNGWLQFNYAKTIKVGKARVAQKIAFTMDEYSNIVKTADAWTDRYYKTNRRAGRLRAFTLALRYLGQRLSDTAMLGPDNLIKDGGNWFVVLTQIKTGNGVKIPVPVELVERLNALPILGATKEPFVLHRANYSIDYGTQFWFWTADIPEGANAEKINQVVESLAKNWSDDITALLAKTEKAYSKFKHHATPHTFRHFFAITMLRAGVPIEQVSKWLGHSSPLVTARHYSNANSDWHDNSHRVYMDALKALEPASTGKVLKMPKAG